MSLFDRIVADNPDLKNMDREEAAHYIFENQSKYTDYGEFRRVLFGKEAQKPKTVRKIDEIRNNDTDLQNMSDDEAIDHIYKNQSVYKDKEELKNKINGNRDIDIIKGERPPIFDEDTSRSALSFFLDDLKDTVKGIYKNLSPEKHKKPIDYILEGKLKENPEAFKGKSEDEIYGEILNEVRKSYPNLTDDQIKEKLGIDKTSKDIPKEITKSIDNTLRRIPYEILATAPEIAEYPVNLALKTYGLLSGDDPKVAEFAADMAAREQAEKIKKPLKDWYNVEIDENDVPAATKEFFFTVAATPFLAIDTAIDKYLPYEKLPKFNTAMRWLNFFVLGGLADKALRNKLSKSGYDNPTTFLKEKVFKIFDPSTIANEIWDVWEKDPNFIRQNKELIGLKKLLEKVKDKEEFKKEFLKNPEEYAFLPEIKYELRRNKVKAGKTINVYDVDNNPYEGYYAVVDKDKVIASHNTDLREENPLYDKRKQPRDRTKYVSEEQAQAIERKFQPDRLGASTETGHGAPIVDNNFEVLDGNMRTIVLKRLYERNPKEADKYKKFLMENAEDFGLKKEDIADIEHPILVRVIPFKNPEHAIDFAEKANKPHYLGQSPVEVAEQDARHITDDMLELLKDDETAAGLEGAKNRDFIRAFLNSLPRNERASYVDSNNNLTSTGIQRITNALFHKVFNNKRLTMNVAESLHPELKRLQNALLSSLHKIAKYESDRKAGVVHDIPIADKIAEGAEIISLARHGDWKDVAEYLTQKTIDGFGKTFSEEGKRYALEIEKRLKSAKQIREFIEEEIQKVRAKGNPRQSTMFNMPKDKGIPNDLTVMKDTAGSDPTINYEMSNKNPEDILWWDEQQENIPLHKVETPINYAKGSFKIKKPVSTMLIDRQFKELFSGRFYKRKRLGGARGTFDPNTSAIMEVIEKKTPDGWLYVRSHEVGHYIDYALFPEEIKKLKEKHKDILAKYSYTTNPKLVTIEGFANFNMAYLADYDFVKKHSPELVKDYEAILKKNPKFFNKLAQIQKNIHTWRNQGSYWRGKGSTGKWTTVWADALHTLMYRQWAKRYYGRMMDSNFPILAMEKDLLGKRGLAYTYARMVQHIPIILRGVIDYATPRLDETGQIRSRGKPLAYIFRGISDKKGKRMLEYFAAKQQEVMAKQGQLIPIPLKDVKQILKEIPKSEKERKLFEDRYLELQTFFDELLDFYEQMGSITPEEKMVIKASKPHYFPMGRMVEKFREGEHVGMSSGMSKRKGSLRNFQDPLDNLISSVHTGLTRALKAKAKAEMYREIIESPRSAEYAIKAYTDWRKIFVDETQLANKIFNAMEELGADVVYTPKGKKAIIFGEDIKTVDDVKRLIEEQPEIAEFWISKIPETKNVILVGDSVFDTAVIDGKRYYFEVPTDSKAELLADMLIKKVRYEEKGHLWYEIFTKSKRAFTKAITGFPPFKLVNKVIDSYTAAVMEDAMYVPVFSEIKAAAFLAKNVNFHKELMLNGAGFTTRWDVEGKGRLKVVEGLLDKGLRSRVEEALNAVEKLYNIDESSTRMSIAIETYLKTNNFLEAAYKYNDSTVDFAIRSDFELINAFRDFAPFFSPWLNSMHKLVKDVILSENYEKRRQKIAKITKRGLFWITLPTIVNFLYNKNNPKYWDRTDDEIARYDTFYLSGGAEIHIPRAHVFSFPFAVIPELILKEMFAKEDYIGRVHLGKAIAMSLQNEFSVGLNMPLFKTGWDLERNKNFAGSPIIPKNMLNIKPELQYKYSTPEFIRRYAQWRGKSPIEYEYKAKQLLGYLYKTVENVLDYMLWDEDKYGAYYKTQSDLINDLTMYRIYEKYPHRSQALQDFYILLGDAMQAKDSFSTLNRRVKAEKAYTVELYKKYGKNYKTKQAFLTALKTTAQTLRKIDDYYWKLLHSKEFTTEEKQNFRKEWFETKRDLVWRVMGKVENKYKEFTNE